MVYPDSDGMPMADNTLQYEWITTIKGNLDVVFRDDANVFVAGDLLWYPVQGRPEVRARTSSSPSGGPGGIAVPTCSGRGGRRAAGRLRDLVAGQPAGGDGPEMGVLRPPWGRGNITFTTPPRRTWPAGGGKGTP